MQDREGLTGEFGYLALGQVVRVNFMAPALIAEGCSSVGELDW